MGRQIAIVTDWNDELSLLRKIAELADSDLRVFRRGFADTAQFLWIDNWRIARIPEPSYGVWPLRFEWKPRYRQIKPPCVPQVDGKWVVANESAAPVIEFSRHLHLRGSAGRLYWSKYFSATKPLTYDVEQFDRLVSGLWRWIRKVGVVDATDAYRPYVLPHTLRRRGKRAQ